MTRTKALLAATTAGLFTAASAGFTAATADQVMTSEGHKYACTGVGNTAQNDPRWDDFPLKMVFTNKEGDYLGDVSVTLSNEAGDVVLTAKCDGPWLVAELASGRYSAKLTAQGQYEQAVDFRIGADGQTEVVVPFPGVEGT